MDDVERQGEEEATIVQPLVYVVHRQADDALAEKIARGLHARGIECWYDGWEILGGDNFVAKMDDGLRRAHGGLILCTPSGVGEGSWSYEEFSALMGRVVDQRHRSQKPFLIPLESGNCPDMPQFLKIRSPLPASDAPEDLDRLAKHILRHCGLIDPETPPLGPLQLAQPPEEVTIELDRAADELTVRCDGMEHGSRLTEDDVNRLRDAVRVGGITRRTDSAASAAAHDRLRDVGRHLEALLGQEIALSLRTRLDLVARPGRANVVIRADDERALSLPWEALTLGDLPALGILARTTLVRAIPVTERRENISSPGPLRVLFAVAAPLDDLDHEEESRVILDAVEGLNRFGAAVGFAEDGATLDAIRAQLDSQPYHVLHISAHGGDGQLWLEDEDGGPLGATAHDLATVLLESAHPPPLVLLSACLTGASASSARDESTAETSATGADTPHMHFARDLIAAGVPAVIAMQHAVSDGYATKLAEHVYRELARSVDPVPAVALAEARRAVERERLTAAERGQQTRFPSPEFATPAAYGEANAPLTALFDGTRPGLPSTPRGEAIAIPGLAVRPVGYAVGRRELQRKIRRALAKSHGAVITGMGGVGKSTLATTVARSFQRKGWLVAVIVGEVSMATVGGAIHAALLEQPKNSNVLSSTGAKHCQELAEANQMSDQELLAKLRYLLRQEKILLILDNFETNQSGPNVAGEFKPELSIGLADQMRHLAIAAEAGAMLITCRYAVPELATYLEHVDADSPLTPVQTARFLWRLPALHALDDEPRKKLLQALGGHPRALEFANALLRDRTKAPNEHVNVAREIEAKINTLSKTRIEKLRRDITDPERAASEAARLAAEDVLLEALLSTVDPEHRRLLNAMAIFRRGVPVEAIVEVACAAGLSLDARAVDSALEALHDRTLVAMTGPMVRNSPDGGKAEYTETWLVHRWTASWLLAQTPPEASLHCAAADWWYRPKAIAWEDAFEALDHWMEAGAWVRVDQVGESMFHHLAQHGQSVAAVELARSIIARRPMGDAGSLRWRGMEIESSRAFESADRLIAMAKASIAEGAPPSDSGVDQSAQKEYATILSILGDLYRALGQGEQARQAYA
ncbi:MAG: CHAT domain-containing protein, partial [Gammaproteobacteria bacterium]